MYVSQLYIITGFHKNMYAFLLLVAIIPLVLLFVVYQIAAWLKFMSWISR